MPVSKTSHVPVPVRKIPPYGVEYLTNPAGLNKPGQLLPWSLGRGDVLATGSHGDATLGKRSWVLEGTSSPTDAVAAARHLLRKHDNLQVVGWGPIPRTAPQREPVGLHLFQVDAARGPGLVDDLQAGAATAKTHIVPTMTEGGRETVWDVHPAHGFVTRTGTFDVPPPHAKLVPAYYEDAGAWGYGD